MPGNLCYPVEATGEIVNVSLSPAAGAEVSYTLPTGFQYRLQTVTYFFTASVAVATRSIKLQIVSGARILWQLNETQTIVASGVTRHVFGRRAPLNQGTGSKFHALPDWLLVAGWIMQTVTLNIQAADQYSLVRLTFSRFKV